MGSCPPRSPYEKPMRLTSYRSRLAPSFSSNRHHTPILRPSTRITIRMPMALLRVALLLHPQPPQQCNSRLQQRIRWTHNNKFIRPTCFPLPWSIRARMIGSLRSCCVRITLKLPPSTNARGGSRVSMEDIPIPPLDRWLITLITRHGSDSVKRPLGRR